MKQSEIQTFDRAGCSRWKDVAVIRQHLVPEGYRCRCGEVEARLHPGWAMRGNDLVCPRCANG